MAKNRAIYIRQKNWFKITPAFRYRWKKFVSALKRIHCLKIRYIRFSYMRFTSKGREREIACDPVVDQLKVVSCSLVRNLLTIKLSNYYCLCNNPNQNLSNVFIIVWKCCCFFFIFVGYSIEHWNRLVGYSTNYIYNLISVCKQYG